MRSSGIRTECTPCNGRDTAEGALPVVFDALADRYDAWYDTAEGAAILREELACLHQVCPERCGRWLEVGVGTGRFASGLGVREGIDPSPKMMQYAAARGIRTVLGTAELLPFADETFDGLLMALTLCFVRDPAQALRDSSRVLRQGGVLLLAVVPADGPWGLEYARKAAEGHRIYEIAHFRTISETVALAEGTRFVLRDSASALLWKPGDPWSRASPIEHGMKMGAGFTALRFEKAGFRVGADVRPDSIDPQENRL